MDLAALGPSVRAAFVAFHLVAVTAMALPAPGGGMNRKAWADPTVQSELRAWNDRFAVVGFEWSDETFQDGLYAFATRFMSLRDTGLKPFRPYYKYCFTGQSWRMFVAPHMYPERLHIDVKIDGAWREVYVERDPSKPWLGRMLDQDRFRSIIFRYSWKSYKTSYGQFGDWLAIQAMRDHPAATAVRARFWKAPSPTPAQARSGDLPAGQWDDVITRQIVRDLPR